MQVYLVFVQDAEGSGNSFELLKNETDAQEVFFERIKEHEPNFLQDDLWDALDKKEYRCENDNALIQLVPLELF